MKTREIIFLTDEYLFCSFPFPIVRLKSLAYILTENFQMKLFKLTILSPINGCWYQNISEIEHNGYDNGVELEKSSEKCWNLFGLI